MEDPHEAQQAAILRRILHSGDRLQTRIKRLNAALAPLATLHRLEDVHGTWSSYMEKTGHAMPGSSKKARPVAADVADTAGAAGKPGVARQVKRARAGTAGKRASAAPGRARR